MRTAIISDIHSNHSALEAVLADIDQRKVQRIICLGDIIGYGPDPVACADLVAERCEWSLLGNHDFGVLYEPTNFNSAAEQAAYWTRRQFEEAAKGDKAASFRITTIAGFLCQTMACRTWAIWCAWLRTRRFGAATWIAHTRREFPH